VGSPPDLRFALVIGVDPARERELGIDGFTPGPSSRRGPARSPRRWAKRITSDTIQVGDAELKRGATIERQLVFPQHLKEFVVVDLETERKALVEPRGVHLLAGSFPGPEDVLRRARPPSQRAPAEGGGRGDRRGARAALRGCRSRKR